MKGIDVKPILAKDRAPRRDISPAARLQIILKLAAIANRGMLSDLEIEVAKLRRRPRNDINRFLYDQSIEHVAGAAYRLFGGHRDDWRQAAETHYCGDLRRDILDLINDFYRDIAETAAPPANGFGARRQQPTVIERANRHAVDHRRKQVARASR